jgi:hypothetical protein
MAFSPMPTLHDGFAQARGLLRLRRCQTYQGFVKARARLGVRLITRLRIHLATLLAGHQGGWVLLGWIVFAVDGSRFDAPRSKANLEHLGVGGREGSGPQMLVTMLVHLGMGALWNWRVGPTGKGGPDERGHMRRLASSTPAGALLVGDAGFMGYDFLRAIVMGGREFLVRLAGNAELITELSDRPDVAAIWPKGRQRDMPPLWVRIIRLRDQKQGEVILATSVLDPARLNDEQAGVFYRMRWGVEVSYRSLKQTMDKRKMLSAAPTGARLELHWTLLAYMLLGVLTTRRLARGVNPASWSVAAALRAVRRSAAARTRPQAQAALRALRQAVRTDNTRKSKAALAWPHKKKQRPPGPPKFRPASAIEHQRLKELALHAA